MEPLRIGVSARLLYPDPARPFLPSKSVQYLEQSVANWVMSAEVLAFMIPELSLATPHAPVTKVKHYVDALDGLLMQGGADMSPQSYGEQPINPIWTRTGSKCGKYYADGYGGSIPDNCSRKRVDRRDHNIAMTCLRQTDGPENTMPT